MKDWLDREIVLTRGVVVLWLLAFSVLSALIQTIADVIGL